MAAVLLTPPFVSNLLQLGLGLTSSIFLTVGLVPLCKLAFRLARVIGLKDGVKLILGLVVAIAVGLKTLVAWLIRTVLTRLRHGNQSQQQQQNDAADATHEAPS